MDLRHIRGLAIIVVDGACDLRVAAVLLDELDGLDLQLEIAGVLEAQVPLGGRPGGDETEVQRVALEALRRSADAVIEGAGVVGRDEDRVGAVGRRVGGDDRRHVLVGVVVRRPGVAGVMAGVVRVFDLGVLVRVGALCGGIAIGAASHHHQAQHYELPSRRLHLRALLSKGLDQRSLRPG